MILLPQLPCIERGVLFTQQPVELMVHVTLAHLRQIRIIGSTALGYHMLELTTTLHSWSKLKGTAKHRMQ